MELVLVGFRHGVGVLLSFVINRLVDMLLHQLLVVNVMLQFIKKIIKLRDFNNNYVMLIDSLCEDCGYGCVVGEGGVGG